MEGLNSIACEHCRAKKCKCDRILPSCSQCRTSALTCRYPEGGKRGIPADYMSSLEKRLEETESALYGALAALEENGSIGSATIPHPSTIPAWHQLSKNEKREEWARLPLKSTQQLAVWFHDKHRYSQAHDENLLRSETTSFPRPGHHSPAERATTRLSEQPLSAVPQQQQIDSGNAQEQLREIEIPSTPTNTRTQTSDPWRNYF